MADGREMANTLWKSVTAAWAAIGTETVVDAVATLYNGTSERHLTECRRTVERSTNSARSELCGTSKVDNIAYRCILQSPAWEHENRCSKALLASLTPAALPTGALYSV